LPNGSALNTNAASSCSPLLRRRPSASTSVTIGLTEPASGWPEGSSSLPRKSVSTIACTALSACGGATLPGARSAVFTSISSAWREAPERWGAAASMASAEPAGESDEAAGASVDHRYANSATARAAHASASFFIDEFGTIPTRALPSRARGSIARIDRTGSQRA
jgi:hypothetical protein